MRREIKANIKVVVILLAVTLSACGSTPVISVKDTFNENDNFAFLIARKSASNHLTKIRAVDLDASVFLKLKLSVKGGTPALQNQTGGATHFSVLKIPAGDYVITESQMMSPFTGVQKSCFANGSVVYRVRAGEISYIDVSGKKIEIPGKRVGDRIELDYKNNDRKKDRVFELLGEVMVNYPHLNQKIMLPQKMGKIKFNAKTNEVLNSIACPIGIEFEVMQKSSG